MKELKVGERVVLGIVVTETITCAGCYKNIISEHNIGIGWLCEDQYCEEAQDGYAAENNIELED